jgi:hypothetical protein
MTLPSPDEWRALTERHVLLFGMSGLGKTHLAKTLRASGRWFHYSVDYRIGTRYMGELIADNAKREAMKVPFLRDLLMSDSIHIGSNITFDNLHPVSTYLGKPGDPGRGGLPFAEYQRRQAEFREAEVGALWTRRASSRAPGSSTATPHFVCDTGGSICEWVDPEDPRDPILTALSQGLPDDLDRGDRGAHRRARPPLRPGAEAHGLPARFPGGAVGGLPGREGGGPDAVDPDDFIRFTYARALAHRQPLYSAMARNWGLKVRPRSSSGSRTRRGSSRWWRRR